MAGTVDVSTGLTLTFGTTSYAAEITGVSADGAEVPVLDTSHMGTTGARTKRFGDLHDEGTLDVTIHFNPDTEPPLGTEETITVTFPVPSGGSTGATAAGTGGISSRNWTAELEETLAGGFTITWTDDVTWTNST